MNHLCIFQSFLVFLYVYIYTLTARRTATLLQLCDFDLQANSLLLGATVYIWTVSYLLERKCSLYQVHGGKKGGTSNEQGEEKSPK